MISGNCRGRKIILSHQFFLKIKAEEHKRMEARRNYLRGVEQLTLTLVASVLAYVVNTDRQLAGQLFRIARDYYDSASKSTEVQHREAVHAMLQAVGAAYNPAAHFAIAVERIKTSKILFCLDKIKQVGLLAGEGFKRKIENAVLEQGNAMTYSSAQCYQDYFSALEALGVQSSDIKQVYTPLLDQAWRTLAAMESPFKVFMPEFWWREYHSLSFYHGQIVDMCNYGQSRQAVADQLRIVAAPISIVIQAMMSSLQKNSNTFLLVGMVLAVASLAARKVTHWLATPKSIPVEGRVKRDQLQQYSDETESRYTFNYPNLNNLLIATPFILSLSGLIITKYYPYDEVVSSTAISLIFSLVTATFMCVRQLPAVSISTSYEKQLTRQARDHGFGVRVKQLRDVETSGRYYEMKVCAVQCKGKEGKVLSQTRQCHLSKTIKKRLVGMGYPSNLMNSYGDSLIFSEQVKRADILTVLLDYDNYFLYCDQIKSAWLIITKHILKRNGVSVTSPLHHSADAADNYPWVIEGVELSSATVARLKIIFPDANIAYENRVITMDSVTQINRAEIEAWLVDVNPANDTVQMIDEYFPHHDGEALRPVRRRLTQAARNRMVIDDVGSDSEGGEQEAKPGCPEHFNFKYSDGGQYEAHRIENYPSPGIWYVFVAVQHDGKTPMHVVDAFNQAIVHARFAGGQRSAALSSIVGNRLWRIEHDALGKLHGADLLGSGKVKIHVKGDYGNYRCLCRELQPAEIADDQNIPVGRDVHVLAGVHFDQCNARRMCRHFFTWLINRFLHNT